ncbi:TetR/AcrR family transcriptional regulator [Actinomycetospora flava]|uniref:TetR/AcrR family transcriptional regulator n=1 Tax=Actinomycetospora flava TaxID=3129232 RepID=A0ABU8MBL0_9PSEU
MTSLVLPPEPHGRRERRVQELLFDIKDAALDQLAEGGDGLSYRAIAARLGVSRATLRYHFPSRDALIEALVADGVTTLARALRSSLDRTRSAPSERRWRAVAHAYRDWALRHRRHYRLLAGARADPVLAVFAELAGDDAALTVHAGLHAAVVREMDARPDTERFDAEVLDLVRLVDGYTA